MNRKAVAGIAAGVAVLAAAVYLLGLVIDGAFSDEDENDAELIPVLTNEVYVSGLKQARFDIGYNSSPRAWKTNTLEQSVIPVEIVPGTGMADGFVTLDACENDGYRNPYTGTVAHWRPSDTTFLYEGEMHMEAGRTYTFGIHIDDAGYIKVADKVVLENPMYKGFASGTFTPESNGWYHVDFRCSDFQVGKGAYMDPNGWDDTIGFGFNTNGLAQMNPQESWTAIYDPGDVSLLRTTDTVAHLGVGKVRRKGKDLLVKIRTLNLPRYAELCAFYGDKDGGKDHYSWTHRIKFADVVPGMDFTDTYRIPGIADAPFVRVGVVLKGSQKYMGYTQFSELLVIDR